MRPLQRLRADLSTGKNLEIYVTALIALGVGVLGVVGAVNPTVVSAATLATLALLAVNALGPRLQVTALERQVAELNRLVSEKISGDVSADAFLTTVKEGLDQRIARGEDIRLAGVTLSRTIRNHFPDLESRLLRGASVKVLLIDLAAGVAQEAARRSTVAEHPEIFENRVRSTLDLLRRLAAAPGAGERLAVRFMPYVPAFGLSMVDPEGEDGVIHVELGTHHAPGPDPVFTLLAARDPHWYQHFLAEFEHMWKTGRAAGPEDGFPGHDS
ncbi:hypothetical protein [Nonomuraea dietziae]|uniref:hypothetical protein n=1 Tax=Nonomuraea dietziae TaxID=65515 RepID=UPI0033DE7D92